MKGDPRLSQVAPRIRELERRLRLASAELGLSRDALQRHLPARVKTGDVAWALEQVSEVERMVEQAASELLPLAALIEAPAGN